MLRYLMMFQCWREDRHVGGDSGMPGPQVGSAISKTKTDFAIQLFKMEQLRYLMLSSLKEVRQV